MCYLELKKNVELEIMKIYKYLFRIVLVLIIMWLITNIVTNLRVLLEYELVERGTVLERFYFLNIASKLFFLFIIAISLKLGRKYVLVTLIVPMFWMFHAYLNIDKLFVEIEYLVVPMLLFLLFYTKEKLNSKVGLPTKSVSDISIIK
jgi:hypothetical protein